jgi:hypothetical protein
VPKKVGAKPEARRFREEEKEGERGDDKFFLKRMAS